MKHLAKLRTRRGWTQRDLSLRCGLHVAVLSRIEGGRREPTVDEALRLAAALDVSLEWLATGQEHPTESLADLAMELRYLGLVDLHVPGERIPGTYRRVEEIFTRAVAEERPEPRVVEAMPALLAWNRWNPALLDAFASATAVHPRTRNRLAWLCDITLLLERTGGLPRAIVDPSAVVAFVNKVDRPEQTDFLGRPPQEATGNRDRVMIYWKIAIYEDVRYFKDRAIVIHNLQQESAR